MTHNGFDWMQSQYSEFAKNYTQTCVEMSRIPFEMMAMAVEVNQRALQFAMQQYSTLQDFNPMTEMNKATFDDGFTKMVVETVALKAEPSVTPVEEVTTVEKVTPVEKVVPEAIATPTPTPKAQTKPASSIPKRDNLTKINGLGPKLQSDLNDLGIFTFEQIAAWTQEDIDEFDDNPLLKSRILRDDWVGQAKDLSAAALV